MDTIFSYLNNLIILSNENFFLSVFIFFIFFTIYYTFSFPGSLIFNFFSGFIYVFLFGFVIVILGLTLGSLFFFIFSKFFFKKLFYNYYKKYTQNLNKYIEKSSYEYLIIFRMIPGPPLMLKNVILSLLEISYFKFILISIIGLTPFNLSAVYIGNKISNLQNIRNISIGDILTWDILIIIILIVLIISIRIKFKNKKRPSM